MRLDIDALCQLRIVMGVVLISTNLQMDGSDIVRYGTL